MGCGVASCMMYCSHFDVGLKLTLAHRAAGGAGRACDRHLRAEDLAELASRGVPVELQIGALHLLPPAGAEPLGANAARLVA